MYLPGSLKWCDKDMKIELVIIVGSRQIFLYRSKFPYSDIQNLGSYDSLSNLDDILRNEQSFPYLACKTFSS